MSRQLESQSIIKKGSILGVDRWWQDFLLISLGAVLLLLLIAFQAWFLAPLRLVLGLAYILYVPRYCLTAALFPRQDDLDSIERTGLSLGLSIAIVPLLALLLDRLPWGIRLWPILLGEIGVIALCMAVAHKRRRSAEIAYAPQCSWRPRPWWSSLPFFTKRIYKVLVGALLVASLSVAWVFMVPSPDEFMTEFYILGQEGLAEAYPREATVGEELAVTMGIMNRERDEYRYRVEVWAVNPWTNERQLLSEGESIRLSRRHGREEAITWAMPWTGDDQQVEGLLFIDNNTDPYRQLRLWLDVAPK